MLAYFIQRNTKSNFLQFDSITFQPVFAAHAGNPHEISGSHPSIRLSRYLRVRLLESSPFDLLEPSLFDPLEPSPFDRSNPPHSTYYLPGVMVPTNGRMTPFYLVEWWRSTTPLLDCIVLYVIVLYYTLLYCTLLHYTILYYTIWWSFTILWLPST